MKKFSRPWSEDVIDEIISPDYIDYGHEPPGKGTEGAKQDYRGARSVFSNTHYTIDELIATGDQVVAGWTGTYILGILPELKQQVNLYC